MIVSVFDSEEEAFEGLSALKALNKDGGISLYATAVISKNDNGGMEMKSVSDKGPIGMSVGLLGGAFVGMLGDPVSMPAETSITLASLWEQWPLIHIDKNHKLGSRSVGFTIERNFNVKYKIWMH